MDGTRFPPDAAPLSLFGRPPEQGRWILIAFGLCINLALGSIYAWSIFVAPLELHYRALGLAVGASDVLLPYSLFLVAFAVTMPLAGRYIDTHGPRRVAVAGGLLTAAGWLLASVSPTPLHLAVAFGGIGGAGVGLAYGVPLAIAARWFPDRRGTALGLTLLGFGISALFTGVLAGALIDRLGVIATFRIFGLAFLLILPALALVLTFPPAGWSPPGWTPPAVRRIACRECTRGEMVRTPTFFGLWICFFIACSAGLMAISISLPVGTEVIGLEPGLATVLVSIFAIFNGGGRPLFGALTDRLNPQNTAMFSFVLILVASILLWQSPSLPVYILSFALLWGSIGAWPAIAPTSTAAFFGLRDYPRCYGVVYLAYGAGAVAGPMLAGSIRTATGSYLGVFPFVAGLAVLGFGCAFWLMRTPLFAGSRSRVPEEVSG
ncbi:MAG: L-lactate MFS transporter [Methanomicrobiales archaeon]